MSVSLPPPDRLASQSLSRKITDPIIAWVMLKEEIEELWIVAQDRDYHSLDDAPFGLVILLQGWDSDDQRIRECVTERWTQIAVRWRKQVAALTDPPLGSRTIFPGDHSSLAAVRQSGARLFLAI